MAGDSDILNRVMRMVIPLRREYNRSLEVRQFMHDLSYAKEIIDQALASKDVVFERAWQSICPTKCLGRATMPCRNHAVISERQRCETLAADYAAGAACTGHAITLPRPWKERV